MDYPLRFVPYLRPMVWGGSRLAGLLHKSLPSPEPYGESWEVSDHPLHHSRVASGPLAGQSLRDLMQEQRPSLLGGAAAKHATFPWLIKFLDVSDWLSVQVHPDAETVRRLLPGEGSKTEAWFVLEAVPGSRVYAGLEPGVDESRLRTALRAGTVADCLHSFEPRPGDCMFLPAGTVHAAGGGIVLAEVQQTSDATFRLFDWNRRDARGRARPLHIEEALACINWKQPPLQPVHVAEFASTAPESQSIRRRLVNCPFFVLEYVTSSEPFTCGGGRLEAVLVLRGRGRLSRALDHEEVESGQVWVLPAAMAEARCHPQERLSALICSLPE